MKRSSYKRVFLIIYTLLFVLISKILFINVYDEAGLIIDEIFHVPQGVEYCQLNFTAWNPKITTLPGLYLVSTFLMAPFGLCTIYWLRLTNLIAATLNVVLFTSLFNLEQDGQKPLSWPALLSGVNMTILPPLYFFSHVYYTDTLSVTIVVLLVVLARKGHHLGAAYAGACAVLVRQTNIIWVLMVFGQHVLDLFVRTTSRKTYRSRRIYYDYWDFYNCYRNFLLHGANLNKLTKNNYVTVSAYLSVIFAFVSFVIINGSIVVGDKTAHEATLHVPQLFYFSLFCTVFAFPHFVEEIIPFVRAILRKKLLSVILFCLCGIIVHHNTLVHPYLLADNRHYTFYIWNKIYGRFYLAKYVLVGAYMFAIYAIFKKINPIKNFAFWLFYIPSVILVLTLQKLVDIRYFFIPFILLRSKFRKCTVTILIVEYVLYVIVNCQTFHIFFTKEVIWPDLPETQRIIW